MSIYEIVKRIAKHYGNTTENLNKISTVTLKQKAGRPPRTGFILDKSINKLGLLCANVKRGKQSNISSSLFIVNLLFLIAHLL